MNVLDELKWRDDQSEDEIDDFDYREYEDPLGRENVDELKEYYEEKQG